MATVEQITSGDHTTGHVITAAVVGGALATLTVWLISLFGLTVPETVSAAFSILDTVFASWAMQRLSV